MKIDNHLDDSKEKIELSVEKKQEVEQFIFRGELKPQPNQRVFKLDMIKGEVSEAQFFSDSKTVNYLDVLHDTDAYRERKILIKEGYDYEIALNMKNALRIFRNKWPQFEEIKPSEESEANRLKKNQKEVKKYSSQ